MKRKKLMNRFYGLFRESLIDLGTYSIAKSVLKGEEKLPLVKDLLADIRGYPPTYSREEVVNLIIEIEKMSN